MCLVHGMWFSTIKVVIAIVVFIITGAWMLLSASGNAQMNFQNYVQFGGFLPKGWSSMWIAVIVAV